jgi:ERCC4-type nuclease
LGSARRVRESSVAELAAVPKVTPKLAQRIYEHFHPPTTEEPSTAGVRLDNERGQAREGVSDA